MLPDKREDLSSGPQNPIYLDTETHLSDQHSYCEIGSRQEEPKGSSQASWSGIHGIEQDGSNKAEGWDGHLRLSLDVHSAV